ncbi:MAG: cysteine hydrolase [Bacteroidales bacterium]|nr:cysteine hydrolase [Bacteroidales bacterium]
MKLFTDTKPALILIDIQKGFKNPEYWGGGRNNPDAEKKAGEILKLWRENGLPIFHVRHCSTNPSSLLHESNKGNEFNDFVKPESGETIIKKNVNSAFIGTSLKEMLKEQNIRTLVFAGLTTDHCVSTSVRMSGNFGFDTLVISDATATFDKTGTDGKKYPAELVHEISLASLEGEFARLITTDALKAAFK